MHPLLKKLLAPVLACVLLASCSPTPSSNKAQEFNGPVLDKSGWNEYTYQRILELVSANKNSGKKAIFDFDNTTIARDISEAVVGQISVDKAIKPSDISTDIAPTFILNNKKVNINQGLGNYYEAAATAGSASGNEFGDYSYLLLPAQYFANKPLSFLVNQVKKAYANGIASKDLTTGKESTVGGFGRPFVYPQMADLYGFLRNNGIDVWIVSAGITWTVRWLVHNAMNPVITAKYGEQAAMPMSQVLGMTTLLRDERTGELVYDNVLAHNKANQEYLDLDQRETRHFTILAQPSGVLTWRGGKVGGMQNFITRERPLLVGGDASGDFEILNMAENRLWIARLDKPTKQKAIAEQIQNDQQGNWLIQPTISSAPVGFVPNS